MKVFSEWMWFVLHISDNNQWIVSQPFTNNTSAYEEAKRLARVFACKAFVVETSHIAQSPGVEFRPINKQAIDEQV